MINCDHIRSIDHRIVSASLSGHGMWSLFNRWEMGDKMGETCGRNNNSTTEEVSLVVFNNRLDADVKKSLETKKEKISQENHPRISDYAVSKITSQIQMCIATNIRGCVEVTRPRDYNYREKYDLTVDTNPLNYMEHRGIEMIEIEPISAVDKVKSVNVVGPYINIKIDEKKVGGDILQQVLDLGENYGKSSEGDPKVVVIDYSSPNIAKKMTVAHLRSTIIGQSLMNLQEAIGNVPFGINHIGDWGSQFGGVFYKYLENMQDNPESFQHSLQENPTEVLLKIYREFNEQKKADPELNKRARELWHRVEKGDSELVALWQKFREWSLEEFAKTYVRLGITFDAIQGESFYEDKMSEVLEEAIKAGVLQQNDDNSIVFPSQELIDGKGRMNNQIMLDKDNQPKDEILQKPDGGTVYLTRDLAAIRYRAQELGADEVYYVIGKEQDTHCIKLFNMAKQLGYFVLEDVRHVSFGHLNVDGRKMKSREGKVVLLDELLDSAVESAKKGMQERNELLIEHWTGDDEERARSIGTSALIFDDLSQFREKDMEFNFDVAEKITDSGSVKVQYTHARLNKLIEKSGVDFDNFELKVPGEISPQEKTILMDIMWFPIIVHSAAEKAEPHRVANYLSDFARTINSFYKTCSVLNESDETTRNFRLALVKASKQVIENAAELLHITMPGEV